jgi:hypothetical protein
MRRQLCSDHVQVGWRGASSRPLARFRSLWLGLARFSSLGGGGDGFKFVNHPLSRGGGTEKPRFSLNYEGFFTLPLTLLNKKS